jgi:hypothetical protein
MRHHRYGQSAKAGRKEQAIVFFRGLRVCVVLVLAGLSVGVFVSSAGASSCANEALREARHETTLPDCRAYEMVSPPAKNGGDVLANSQRTRAAADGSAVMFASLSVFADALGTGVATEYMAERSTSADPGNNGWATHAITPEQTPQSFLAAGNLAEAAFQGEVSPDLTKGAIRTFSPLTDAPNVALTQNLYLRSDLRTAGPGSYELLNDCLAPPDGPCTQPLPEPYPAIFGPSGNQFPLLTQYRPWLAGASADFNQVLFEDAFTLTNDAPGALNFASIFKPKLYESDHGVVSYVGLVPPPGQTTCTGVTCQAAPSSIAGQGAAPAPNAHYTPHTISADGTRTFFTANPTGCAIGAFTCGELYMRSNNGTPSATSVQLNASERTDCADNNPCNGTPEPDPTHDTAAYWDASVDGTRVFFMTREALTDNAPLGTGEKLYMYDTSLPDTDPHNLTLLNPDNEPADGTQSNCFGVIGSSDDGHYVYFTNSGQLVPGAPLGGDGIFLWHDGQISYVGAMTSTNDELFDDVGNFGSVLTFVKRARVSADGRTLLFSTTSGTGLLSPPYNHGGHRELYVYRADTEKLSCASCNPSGAAGTADASPVVRTRSGGSSTTTYLNHALSDDGRYVFFSTAEALVPADSNGKSDAYEYDTETGKVSLLSSGTDPADSYFLDASASGDDAFILTRQQLSKWDTDQNYDIYDVRVNGGFPEPPAPVAGCSGDGCQGAQAQAPGFDAPSSAAFTGAGNLPPAPTTSTKPASRASLLARALKVCRKKHARKQRKRCETGARHRYGQAARVGRSG